MSARRYFYLDASALAKRYAPEIGSSVVDHLFARLTPDRLVVFDVGMAEVISLLVRKRNSGKLSANNFSQVLIDFKSEIELESLAHRCHNPARLSFFSAVPGLRHQ
jgi:predicted nucleic acid-binding protein